MSEADVRQALCAAFNDLDRDVVCLVIDSNVGDLSMAITQLKQLQPKHRPIILPSGFPKKTKPKKPPAAASASAVLAHPTSSSSSSSSSPPAPKGRVPQLPPPNPALPSRGWWPRAESAPHQLSEQERAALSFVCEIFPSLEVGTAAAVLADLDGRLEAAVELLTQLEHLAPPSQPAPVVQQHQQEEEKPPAAAVFDEAESDEAFPPLKRAETAMPRTRKAQQALERLQPLFPLAPSSSLVQVLNKHEWNVEAAANELLSAPEVLDESDDQSSHAPRRLTWSEMNKLVKRPVARPWGQLLCASPPPPPPPPSSPLSTQHTSEAAEVKSDLSSRLKYRMLRARLPWVDHEVLESVWLFSNCSLLRTVHALAVLYPHAFLTELLPALDSSTPSSTSSSSSSPAAASTSTLPPPLARYIVDASSSSSSALSSEEARAAAVQRHLLCKAAAQAFVAGNGPRARQLAAEARRAGDEVRAVHDAHWRAAHAQAVQRGAPVLEVDLHGLTVEEALQVLERVMRHMRQALLEDPSRPRLLSLITGVGKHSPGGSARIRPAVLNHLKSLGVPFNEVRSGHIVVRVANV